MKGRAFRYCLLILCSIGKLQAQNTSLIFTNNPLAFKYVSKGDSSRQQLTQLQFINFYRARGYAACAIDSVVKRNDSIIVHTYIGQVYKIKGFSIAQHDIRKGAVISIGEKYTNSTLDTNGISAYANSVLTVYENNGYPFATIIVDSVITLQNKLGVYLSLDKGPLFLYDTVYIEGDRTVKKSFLSAYLGMKEGKPYNESTYRKAYDKLSQLPFIFPERFPQMVFIKGGKARPYLYLKKKKADQVNGIVGLAPTSATTSQASTLVFTGEFLLKLNNLFKSGKMLMINWKSFQARSQELKTAFNFPYIMGRPIGADVSFDFLKYDTSYSNLQRQIGIQFYTSGINGFKAFYKVNSTNLITVDTNAVRNKKQFPSTNSIQNIQYGIAGNFNFLDYRFNPRKGILIEGRMSAGTKEILKDNRISEVRFSEGGGSTYTLYDSTKIKTTQYNLQLKIDKYFPVGVKSTIKAGFSTEQIIAPVIYFNEVMREGGINSLKGFNEQSIYATNFNMLELEYRYLLGVNTYIKAFWNGAYYEDHTTGRDPVYDTPWGFGIGANIETKAGILTILYALGKEKQNNFDLRAGKVHFGISSYF
ncbi:MAG: hypothetical protein V4613_08345 [Bacteroidota bacterium]